MSLNGGLFRGNNPLHPLFRGGPPITTGLLGAGGKRLADGTYQKADMSAVPPNQWQGPRTYDGSAPVNITLEDLKFKDTRKPARGETISCVQVGGYHNLTVRRCAYWGYGNFLGGSLGGGWLILEDCDSQAMLLLDEWLENGRFCDLSEVGGVLVRNNYGDGVATIFINNATDEANRVINCNLFKNISGGFITPPGEYPGKSMKQAIQINGGTNTQVQNALEIAWNISLLEPGAGRCEDLISVHGHVSPVGVPALVHNNLLDQNHGPYTRWMRRANGNKEEASNGGIMTENGTKRVKMFDNTVLNCSVYGLAAAENTEDIDMINNRVVSTGRYLSGPDQGKIIPRVNCGLYASMGALDVLMQGNYLACVFANMPALGSAEEENLSLMNLVRNDIGTITPTTVLQNNYHWTANGWNLNDSDGDGSMPPVSLITAERALYYQKLNAKRVTTAGFEVGPRH